MDQELWSAEITYLKIIHPWCSDKLLWVKFYVFSLPNNIRKLYLCSHLRLSEMKFQLFRAGQDVKVLEAWDKSVFASCTQLLHMQHWKSWHNDAFIPTKNGIIFMCFEVTIGFLGHLVKNESSLSTKWDMFKKPIKDQEVKTFEASFSLQWVTCSTSFKINRKEIDFINAKFLLHTFMTCFSSASLTSRH